MWLIPSTLALIPPFGIVVDFTGSFQPASVVALIGLVAATGILLMAAWRLGPPSAPATSVVVRPGRSSRHGVRERTPHAYGRLV
jgi:hypothetical protein